MATMIHVFVGHTKKEPNNDMLLRKIQETIEALFLSLTQRIMARVMKGVMNLPRNKDVKHTSWLSSRKHSANIPQILSIIKNKQGINKGT